MAIKNKNEKTQHPNCLNQFPVGLYRKLFEETIMESPYGYVIVSLQEDSNPIVFVNHAFEAITGYHASEALGLRCSFLLGGDDDQDPLSELRDAVKAKRKSTQVVRNYRKNGSLFYNELSVTPIIGQSGDITHLVWTQHDITASIIPKEGFLAYKQKSNEALWRLDFNPPISMNSPENEQIQAVMERGIFGEANVKAAQIYGFKQGEEIRGHFLKEYLVGADQNNIKMITRLVRCRFHVDRIIVTEKTIEGNHIVTLNNVMPTITEEGVKHLWGTGLDITELFNTKEKLQLSKDKLAAQKKILEKKNIALKEILTQIEIEKKDVMDRVVSYISEVALPSLEKIRLNKWKNIYFDLHRKALEDLVSPHNHKLNKIRSLLTPREMEVCNLVKNGNSNKEIARLLSIAEQTVMKHRRMVRKKIGINNKKVNLYNYLNSL